MLPPDVEALVLAASSGPVAFDADGTLWRGDVGEELLHELGRFEEYERRVREDPIGAYTWAVEILAGHDERELYTTCERLFDRQHVFPFVAGLLDRLDDVYIVSASPRWAVEVGARALGIDPARVIAVDCGVSGGRLDGKVVTPIPCGTGKVHHLKARKVAPVLAFGNGDLDEPMLKYAKTAVVVAPFSGAENGLTRAAQGNRWPILRA